MVWGGAEVGEGGKLPVGKKEKEGRSGKGGADTEAAVSPSVLLCVFVTSPPPPLPLSISTRAEVCARQDFFFFLSTLI